MDAAFVSDYSVGTGSSEMTDKLSSAFAEVAASAEASVSAGPHITYIWIVKGCNYGCLRQKTLVEDAYPVPSRPCMVVWDDLANLARYKLADAVFYHLSASSSLTGSRSLTADTDYSPQQERPSLEHSRAYGATIERGERPLLDAGAQLQSLISSDPLPETRTVVELLVKPLIADVKGTDSLPSEGEYVGAVLAAELAYSHGQKIIELWDLAIVMWECGAIWTVGVAGLCYTHTGNSNYGRAREDLPDITWS
ncbi:hypothetical protein N7522_004512 [Penicillium canescens]|nr:hypothetical protein N7522_004512 [Penicillium canescens]